MGFDAIGTKSLRSLPDPVRVFRVKPEAEKRPSWWRAALALGFVVVLGAVAVAVWRGFLRDIVKPTAAEISSPIRSIAVLPLENLTGDPEQEYFADGMTEALIGDLAKLQSLSVISRSSVMRYKRSDRSLPEVARELNVEGIIEGTVIRDGDRVRITVQLLDARSDRRLWSERYDRPLRDVIALHREVARAVAEQIRLELSPEERAALTTSRPVDPGAYDAYLRGLQLSGPATLVGVWGERAIEQFERAVELGPGFAEAWVRLAEAYRLLGTAGFDLRYRSEFPKAQAAAQRALELDDRLGSAHASLGAVRMWYGWDFPGAQRAIERAVQLSPGDPITLDVYVWYLLTVEGRTEKALAVSERLLHAAPFDRYMRATRLRLLLHARQYERALDEATRAREVVHGFADLDIGSTYFMLGRLEEAHRAFMAVSEQCGASCDWEREARERGWAEGGFEGSLRIWLEAATRKGGYSPWMIAISWAMVGETDEAFAWLDRGYRARDPLMIFLRTHPGFDSIRSDPRFDDLLRRIGFPES